MTIVTVTGAAKLARVSRGTIYNKIEAGELSKGPEGIDTSELLRVFGTLHDVSNDAKEDPAEYIVNGKSKTNNVMARQNDEITQKLIEQLERADAESEWLRDMVERQERQLKERDQRIEDQQQEHAKERNAWALKLDEVNNSMQKLLPAPEDMKPRKKLFGWF